MHLFNLKKNKKKMFVDKVTIPPETHTHNCDVTCSNPDEGVQPSNSGIAS